MRTCKTYAIVSGILMVMVLLTYRVHVAHVTSVDESTGLQEWNLFRVLYVIRMDGLS